MKRIEKTNLESIKTHNTDEQISIIEQFTPEEQAIIIEKLKIFSVIPKIIGRDFDMPVLLNKPNAGWHWDFGVNVVRVDPVDLLTKPIEYLRFVMAHEGGHRRISRTDFIPTEVWGQTGFSFLINSIEDPRDNNFLADVYPNFREEAHLAYEANLELAEKMKAKAGESLGYQPRFMQAGFEFIRLWFSWFKKQKAEIDSSLPGEVQEVVKKALSSAEDAWSRYPSKDEADGEKGQETIREFAKLSYDIIFEEIWPEYQKLVEKDLEDQKMSEFLKDLQEKKQKEREKSREDDGESSPSSDEGDSEVREGGSAEEKNELTQEEREEMERAMEKAIKELGEDGNSKQEEESSEGKGGKKQSSSEGTPEEVSTGRKSSGKPIPLDSLSPELREKLRKKIASLSEEQKKKLAEKAEKVISDFEKSVSEELQGKMSENPIERETREKLEEQNSENPEDESEENDVNEENPVILEEENEERENDARRQKEIDRLHQELERITQGDNSVYENNRREVQSIINNLTNDLRNIFRKRRENKYEAGRKSGKRINIATRIKEIAKGIASFDSRAWVRREAPMERDYAFTILVDLSGSMRGEKIEETFKAVIALTESLGQLGIKTEILGFNDRLHEYLSFGKKLTKEVRDKMSVMLKEVDSLRARYNDDGWAVLEASNRLAKQQETERIMVVLSDGEPVESGAHKGSEFELKSVVDRIVADGKEKIIGLGIGYGTEHVSHYYPNSIASVSVEEMAKRLAELIIKVIEPPSAF